MLFAIGLLLLMLICFLLTMFTSHSNKNKINTVTSTAAMMNYEKEISMCKSVKEQWASFYDVIYDADHLHESSHSYFGKSEAYLTYDLHQTEDVSSMMVQWFQIELMLHATSTLTRTVLLVKTTNMDAHSVLEMLPVPKEIQEQCVTVTYDKNVDQWILVTKARCVNHWSTVVCNQLSRWFSMVLPNPKPSVLDWYRMSEKRWHEIQETVWPSPYRIVSVPTMIHAWFLKAYLRDRMTWVDDIRHDDSELREVGQQFLKLCEQWFMK